MSTYIVSKKANGTFGCLHWRLILGIGIQSAPNTTILAVWLIKVLWLDIRVQYCARDSEGKIWQAQSRALLLDIARYSGDAYRFGSLLPSSLDQTTAMVFVNCGTAAAPLPSHPPPLQAPARTATVSPGGQQIHAPCHLYLLFDFPQKRPLPPSRARGQGTPPSRSIVVFCRSP
jgi:hypothetical protein